MSTRSKQPIADERLERGTRLIPNEHVAEVVRILATLPRDLDALDTVELRVELDEEYGAENVRLALRFIEAMSADPAVPSSI
jgi:hypothetical protein